MQFRKNDDTYILKLEPTEKIIETITNFAIKEKISSAFIQGIGAASKIEIGYFDEMGGSYNYKTFSGGYEIVNLSGNISLFENNPFPHIHITIGDREHNLYGGHLKEAVISVTGEIIITSLNIHVERTVNTATGLKLLSL